MNIGILGAGQLGRMLALAGYRLGFDFTFLDPDPQACARGLGEHLCADYGDAGALEQFCARAGVATWEFENVPAKTAELVAQKKPLYPHPRALAVGQDRLAEKQLFERLGIAVPKYAPVDARADLDRALERVGFPAVLKTRRLGYDGKGQSVLRTAADVEAAWTRLGSQPLILEAFVDFERELSCLAVRSRGGQLAFYPVCENLHRDGILRRSIPRPGDRAQALAEEYARVLLERLDYVGVLAFELFDAGGALLANEIAPRVHNSGHWTIDGAVCSQFENHLRAVAGLPLGATAARGPCAMLNLVGALPDLSRLTGIPGAQVHLYGKAPKPGRKVGHVTLTAASAPELEGALARAEALLPS